MKKGFLSVVSLCIAFCFLLSGCSSTDKKEDSTSSGPEEEQSQASYTTQEIWTQNGDMKIYGVAYIPDTKEKSPLVIFSHELGNDHTSGERYAERLAGGAC